MSGNEFKITVTDGTTLEVKLNKAKKDTIGVIHLLHGMAEHMDRYNALVESLNQQGYDVLRHNHRGHGIDIESYERGHIDSMEQVADDTFEIAQTMYSDSVHTPYIILGHSMGSIIARIFTQKYPEVAQGMILSGTMQYTTYRRIRAQLSLTLITLITGTRRRLKWLNLIMFKDVNKHIKNNKSVSDWLSRDDQEVEVFAKDPSTGCLVSNQF